MGGNAALLRCGSIRFYVTLPSPHTLNIGECLTHLDVFSISEWLLAEHLKDSTIHYVMVDGEVKMPAALLAELQG